MNDMKNAPRDRRLILFLNQRAAAIGNWHNEPGWIAEHKDGLGNPLIAQFTPTGWLSMPPKE